MKRLIFAVLLIVVLLLAYWVWPFAALGQLAANVQARNAAAVSEQIDFPRLRDSLTGQIIAEYLRITGRANKLGPIGNAVASALGASIADPWVSQIINPENLEKLLGGQTVPTDYGGVSFKLGELPSGSLQSALQLWPAAGYGFGRFYLTLPTDAAPADQFRLEMRLRQWRWKLTGVGLPQVLRTRIAQELAKKFP